MYYALVTGSHYGWRSAGITAVKGSYYPERQEDSGVDELGAARIFMH
jgi:hypothetical protein